MSLDPFAECHANSVNYTALIINWQICDAEVKTAAGRGSSVRQGVAIEKEEHCVFKQHGGARKFTANFHNSTKLKAVQSGCKPEANSKQPHRVTSASARWRIRTQWHAVAAACTPRGGLPGAMGLLITFSPAMASKRQPGPSAWLYL